MYLTRGLWFSFVFINMRPSDFLHTEPGSDFCCFVFKSYVSLFSFKYNRSKGMFVFFSQSLALVFYFPEQQIILYPKNIKFKLLKCIDRCFGGLAVQNQRKECKESNPQIIFMMFREVFFNNEMPRLCFGEM